jgi:hypothetical protein
MQIKYRFLNFQASISLEKILISASRLPILHTESRCRPSDAANGAPLKVKPLLRDHPFLQRIGLELPLIMPNASPLNSPNIDDPRMSTFGEGLLPQVCEALPVKRLIKLT